MKGFDTIRYSSYIQAQFSPKGCCLGVTFTADYSVLVQTCNRKEIIWAIYLSNLMGKTNKIFQLSLISFCLRDFYFSYSGGRGNTAQEDTIRMLQLLKFILIEAICNRKEIIWAKYLLKLMEKPSFYPVFTQRKRTLRYKCVRMW